MVSFDDTEEEYASFDFNGKTIQVKKYTIFFTLMLL